MDSINNQRKEASKIQRGRLLTKRRRLRRIFNQLHKGDPNLSIIQGLLTEVKKEIIEFNKVYQSGELWNKKDYNV